MNPKIVDKTAEYSTPEAYVGQQGVYLMLVQNRSKFEIVDRNKHKDGDGRRLVKPQSYSLKSGKFEQGIQARMYLNHEHLRRVDKNGREREPHIFASTLRLLLVHVTNPKYSTDVEEIEIDLKHAVRDFLKNKGIHDPAQKGGLETRYIIGTPPSDQELRDLFEGVLQKYDRRRRGTTR